MSSLTACAHCTHCTPRQWWHTFLGPIIVAHVYIFYFFFTFLIFFLSPLVFRFKLKTECSAAAETSCLLNQPKVKSNFFFPCFLSISFLKSSHSFLCCYLRFSFSLSVMTCVCVCVCHERMSLMKLYIIAKNVELGPEARDEYALKLRSYIYICVYPHTHTRAYCSCVIIMRARPYGVWILLNIP